MDEAEKKGDGKIDGAETAPEDEAREQTPLVSEVEQLRHQLEAKELEAKENYDRYLRQAAELDNFKKRTAREKAESIRYANETLMREILTTLDNLERAVEHAKGEGNGKPLVEGIEMVLKGFLEALNRHGLNQIAALGVAFNPEKHEAFAQVERTDCESNTVVEEHHKGYYLFDRLLRPALVTISKLPESEGKKSSEGEVENGEGDD